jgi:hypothetical protein
MSVICVLSLGADISFTAHKMKMGLLQMLQKYAVVSTLFILHNSREFLDHLCN